MHKTTIPSGIKGLGTPKPYGSLVKLGRKVTGQSQPIEKDRFHFLSLGFEKTGAVTRDGKEIGGYAALMHPVDPRFAAWSKLPPEKRKTLHGYLMHANIADAVDIRLTAGSAGKGRPRNSAPACTGNGEIAERWTGEYDAGGLPVYKPIVCPHDLCQFRQGKKKECKPSVQLWFVLRWPGGEGLPEMGVKYYSQSWETGTNLNGLIAYIAQQAHDFGLKEGQWSYFGAPFVMTTIEQHKPHKGQNYPIVKFDFDGNCGAWLEKQVAHRQRLLASPVIAGLLGAGPNPEIGDMVALGALIDDLDPDAVPTIPRPATQERQTVSPDRQTVSLDVVDAEVVEERRVELPYKVDPADPRGAYHRILDHLTAGEKSIDQQRAEEILLQCEATHGEVVGEPWDDAREARWLAECERLKAWYATADFARRVGAADPPADATIQELKRTYLELKKGGAK